MEVDVQDVTESIFVPSERLLKRACSVCGFALWHPVCDLEFATLALYSDARFPGRCILALNRHADYLEELDSSELQGFMDAVNQASRAIREVTGCMRVNVAILGNRDPHVHAHLIPRYGTDPLPNDAPWSDPRPKKELGQSELKNLVEKLRRQLT
ncbi:HIT family protein [Streptomyces canus]|uniref:HIT family protein n=1 Tax=Streptomyces canus TaxID=58343 RepID=UPI003247EE45